jgi:hypothetical protein
MNTSTALSRRLASFEICRCYFGRKKMLLVSSSALIGLFPPKREYWQARAAIMELIAKHPDKSTLCHVLSHPLCIEMNTA